MEHLIELSEDAFATLFRPMANHLNPHASFDWGAGYGTLFETYGEEVQYVRAQNSRKIWTLCSGDGGDFVTSGFHYVNRLGYFITEMAVPDGVAIEVPLPDDGDNREAWDIEYRLRQILDECYLSEQLSEESGRGQALSLLRQRLAELNDQLAESESHQGGCTSSPEEDTP